MDPARVADLLYESLESHGFSSRYWEREPLLIKATSELAAAYQSLLSPSDLTALSERLLRREEPAAQVMRDGERSDPREMCLDFLDGGSIVINRVDTFWSPIGKLCQALRSRFLHVFAVLYLTPRASQAVPAHSDDQDVIILQLGGRKIWRVYGAPVELPYTHEQLGKTSPIDWDAVGEPILTCELTAGSVLYLPRGFVHEARATGAGGSSCHVTLTVQSSDLNWSAFVRDGLAELHRQRNEARLPLPLDPGFGGYAGCIGSGGGAGIAAYGGGEGRWGGHCGAAAGVNEGGVQEGDYREMSAGVVEAQAGMAQAALEAMELGATGAAAAAREAATSARRVEELIASTAAEEELAFCLAMGLLREKLEALNGLQDAATDTCEREGLEAACRLPSLLQITPGIGMGVRDDPEGQGGVQLVCTRSGGTLTASFPAQLADALLFLASSCRKGSGAFRPDALPGCDGYEQVALCSRLLAVNVLCDATSPLLSANFEPDADGSGYRKGKGGAVAKGGGGGRGRAIGRGRGASDLDGR